MAARAGGWVEWVRTPVEYRVMRDGAQVRLVEAREIAREVQLEVAGNGLRYGTWGATELPADALAHIVGAVPARLAEVLERRAYYFVPLTMADSEEVEVAGEYTPELSDRAICHRNVEAWGRLSTFISARLMNDRFALAFEFFINVGHQVVDGLPMPERWAELAASQARADVRGESSQDSWEARRRWSELARGVPMAEGAGRGRERGEVPVASEPEALKLLAEATLSDALAIYMLSLSLDFDYADLREREYPLLAAPALAERLRLVAELFPPPDGYEFAIRYRRRR